MNVADMDFLLCGRLWRRNAEYLVHLVHMNRLSASREFCGVHIWETAEDVEIVCHSHLVWLVFEVPSLHALV